ncbi:hypothetical protein KC19_VG083500 [Ceratodon purpureus]|uniref:Uncharacterized protein n=1 Tax=Ceratodon purpureus TaxID=3225 RepID=A0A8T0HNX5_CERPU|nr:hypothetical protein KC19_VG083500 [Ceratodon purpureus]
MNSLSLTGSWVCKNCCSVMSADNKLGAVLTVFCTALSGPLSQVQMMLGQMSDYSTSAILKQCNINSTIPIYAFAKIPFLKPRTSTSSNLSCFII